MKKGMTIKEASSLWGISETRIAKLCREGRIEGAKKVGKSWVIPFDTQRPTDHRIKSGSYIKQRRETPLPLPVGISDYRKASKEYYYIDKTLMIKDFLDERPMVSLFTRPRRFGKTLNMDMLRVFFEKTDEDTSIYFKDKAIWRCGKTYQDYQGKYPVIFITLKDVKYETWEETFHNLSSIIANEFMRHGYLESSGKLSSADLNYYRKVIFEEASSVELANALSMLSKMLHEYHGIAPIIIIDEYDTPIQQGHMCGYYDKIILFMRNLFSGGLKDNKHLSFGFMTGILRVAKESIFSGLNNLKINSILDQRYSEYFGFTPDEVQEMARYYGALEKYDEICEWYDGYYFGKTEIFNPWSVINYFSMNCEPRAYWLSTGSNEIIGEILAGADEQIYKRLHALIQNKSFLTYIDTSVIYPEIQKDPSSIYSFLLVAGYLKVVKSEISPIGDFMCEVALPNKEISIVYKKEVLGKLQNIVPKSISVSIQEAIYCNDAVKLQNLLEKLLMESASCYDTVGENFYHGLVLGLCAMLDDRYEVTSNREAGEGRYDIQLMPRDKQYPGMLIELKAAKHASEEKLQTLAEDALKQIETRKYAAEMKAKGLRTICKYGVAFSGKRVKISKN